MPHRTSHLTLRGAPTIGAPAEAPLPTGHAPTVATISRENLQAMAGLVAARLDGPGELHRLAVLDEVLHAARLLTRSMTELTRHAIAEHRGSHSTWNVRADAEAAFAALRDYASALERITRADPPSAPEPSREA